MYRLLKISRYLFVVLSFLFLFQAITNLSVIPIGKILDILGIGKGIFEIVKAILYLALFTFCVGLIFSLLNKFNLVKGVTKNTIILRLVARFFMAFIIFFPSWILYWLLGGVGVLGNEIKLGLESGKTFADLNQIPFLNIYLFWFILISVFVKPEIKPNFGLEKNEENGLV